ncbi:hypothetical protein EX895_001924 [Sporisorium graminicola]|uniref:C-CAP/cofactor C-like domain-containing protein n=1 Tax=Sporisorium graminicola TaxID=280036 RepID=A0A4U7KXH7_9BASI|nr:hypothetical protein EX895_001924 [Sporisorium graminicola]TKY89393.1 hypothetical protein EX895_001924 [Sporisorium graminicola]
MASSSSVGNASLANASSAQAFYTHFRAATDSLLTRLSNDPSTTTTPELLQQALQTYSGLSAELTQAVDSGVLPTHDQGVHKRRLEEVAAAIEAKRRSVAQQGQVERKNKGGFAFKRKQPAIEAVPGLAVSSRSEALQTSPQTPRATAQDRQSSHLTVSAIHDTRYTHSSTNTTQPLLSKHISIDVTDVSNSIVDLRSLAEPAHTVLAVQIRGVINSALLLPPIEGSVMIHGLKDSLSSVPSCHQFRMHESKDVVVELSTKRGSVVTVEGCSGITFVTRSGEEVKVQDFDDLINSEQLRHQGETESRANFRVIQSRGNGGELADKVELLSSAESSTKAGIDKIANELKDSV